MIDHQEGKNATYLGSEYGSYELLKPLQVLPQFLLVLQQQAEYLAAGPPIEGNASIKCFSLN